MINLQNLLERLPRDGSRETFATLLQSDSFRLERIVSHGQPTPPGEWYDQERPEWVLLLRGSAGLLLEGEGEARKLRVGDHCLIPAHCRHRVEWTDAHQPTVWLALHFDA